ncbi:MAG: hypothetical protein ABSB40_12340 [Nitrososphaeria archaeon]|jgi:hypothetical protein
MLEYAFLIRILGAFVVGGGWVAFVARLGDVLGSNRGGMVAGLPSTAAFGFLFIGWNQSAGVAAEATTEFPLIFSFTGVFLLSYAILATYGFWKALVLSLLIWLGGVSLVVASDIQDFGVSLAVSALISLVVFFVFTWRLKLKKRSSSKYSGSSLEVLLRFILGGGIVVLAVVASQMAGPRIGAIPTAFPAVSVPVLYVLHKSQGTEFSRAVTMPLMVTAMLTIIPYSVAVRIFFPVVGIWWGTAASYLVATPFAALSYFVLKPTKRENLCI